MKRLPPSVCFWLLACLPLYGVRVFMIGNSVTDSVNYSQFQQLAQSRGYTHIWGRQIILGSPLGNIWNNPDQGFRTDPFDGFPNAFANYDWDAITLQTYDSNLATDLDYFGRFLELAWQRPYTAANGEFFTFARWPRQHRGAYLTYWPKVSDGSESLSETADYFEKFTVALRGQYPDVSIRMIPVGHVFYELEQRMRDGLVPGYTDVYSDFYTDGVHQTDDGRYVCALTFFATIYKDDPRGLPLVGFNLKNPAAASIFQEAVWEIVTRTPLSGVESSAGLTITTTRIPRGSVNRAYTATLRALFGTEPYVWTIVEGSLPPGISFSANGLLSGTPGAAGAYPLTLQVQDAAEQTATLSATFEIVVNTIPDILTAATLPSGHQGTPYRLPLEAVLGDPPLVWSLTSGTLPLGLSLSPDGLLSGTPGVTGNFSFTVKVEDDDFPADADTGTLTLSIGPPESNTLSVPRILQTVTIDGLPDESFWNLNWTAVQTDAGTPANQVRFGLAWDIGYLYLAAEITDATPQAGRVPLSDNDSLEVLLDARHDRETVYNSDDRRLILDREARLTEIFGRGLGVLAAVQTTASGYTLEMAVPWDNLQRTPFPGMGVGFDLVNNDNQDGSGRQAILTWDGSDPYEPAPLTFGNLLLSSTIEGQPGGDVLIAYEPFSGPVGPLYNSGVPLGWSQTWGVQNGKTSAYFSESTSLPTYGDHRGFGELLTQGLRGSGGGEYLSSGRLLDVAGAFASLASGGDIGKPGTEVWMSWLVRLDSGGAPGRVSFCTGGIDWVGSDDKITVQNSGNSWKLKVAGLNEIDTGVAAIAGETCLVVVRAQFGSPSTVSLWINPASLGGAAPTAQITTNTTGSLAFRRLHWYPGNGKGEGTLDEIRIGTSYAAVTPLKPYPPILDSQPQPLLRRPGQSATFRVESFSRSPVTYQWFLDSVPIPEATSATLLVDPVTDQDFGQYTVRLTNATGVTLSDPTTLSRDPHPSDGYAAWSAEQNWTLSGDTLPAADPDGDRLPNIFEYLFGLDPLQADHHTSLLGTTLPSASTLTLQLVPLRTDLAVVPQVEASRDLLDWSALPAGVILGKTPDPLQPGMEIWSLQVPNKQLDLPLHLRLGLILP